MGVGTVFVTSSSMRRAIQTADIVAEEALIDPVRLQPVEALKEIGNGELDGRLIADVREELQAISSAWARGEIAVRVGETGDSPKMLQDRAMTGLQDLFGNMPSEASVAL